MVWRILRYVAIAIFILFGSFWFLMYASGHEIPAGTNTQFRINIGISIIAILLLNLIIKSKKN